MITTADFLGYIVISFLMSYVIGYIINGLFSLFKYIR